VSATVQNTNLRRRLLRGVVDENLDTIAGMPIGTMRRHRRRRASRIRRAAVTTAIIVVAGVALAALRWGGDADQGAAHTVALPNVEHSMGMVTVPSNPPKVEAMVERLGISNPEPLVPAVIPVDVSRIAIDPGHGGIDGGTSLGYGLMEKDLTKDIANRLARLLTTARWEVVITRQDDDAVSLSQRAEIANAASADLFLSIHVNWLPDRTARGFETYFLGPTDDPFLRRLAAIENRDSGFALADYRELLQGIYADVRHDQSRQLAEEIQKQLFDTLRVDNPDIVARGVMTAPFAVLVTTDMPAVLVEVACLSNDREARLLALPHYRQRIAEALFSGITHYVTTLNGASAAFEKGS
jgi:N-acetylmuramoyl-L-alanine amidase